jgi:hypothetical protein
MTKSEEYLDRSLEESIPHLEARRRHYRRHFIAGIVCGSIFGLACFALIVVGGILGKIYLVLPGMGAFLFITPIFIFRAIHALNKYKALFATEVAPLFASGVYEGFKADTEKDLSVLKKKMITEMTKKPDDEAASYYEGVYRGVSFFTFGYNYSATGKGHPRAVVGRYYEFTLPHEAACETLVKNKKSPNIFNKRSLPVVVKTESTVFEANHATSAVDDTKAREVLTPLVLVAVNDVEEEYKGNISAYFNGNKTVLYLDDYQVGFKLSINKEVTIELLRSYGEEVTLASKLVKAFGLSR